MNKVIIISLVDTGNRPLTTPFTLYGDLDNFVNPLLTGIVLSDLIDENTPYFVSIPEGVTILRLIDTINDCYIDLPISEVDFCGVANFDFSEANTSLIGRIDVGDLLSNNQGLTDYRIYWYNENDEVSYISGFGDEFTPYSFTHPLIGVNSIFAQAGTYKPVIDKVRINGVNYSQSGDTFDPIPVNVEDCLGDYTVLVDAFNCDNGVNTDKPDANKGEYDHRIQFQAQTNGSSPTALDGTFDLDENIDYFAWAFKGELIPDTIKLTFVGDNYVDPIGLDFIDIGKQNSSSDFSTLPYLFNSQTFYYKIINLENFNRSPNDKIIIEVIPNQNNIETNWDLFFTCLDDYNTNTCIDFQNGFKKLNQQTFQFFPTNNCGGYRFLMDWELCEYILSESFKYGIIGQRSRNFWNFTDSQFDCLTDVIQSGSLICETINEYNFKKVGNKYTFTFTDETDFQNYYGRMVSNINHAWDSQNPPTSDTAPYYGYVQFTFATDETQPCGDNQSYNFLFFNAGSEHISGTTTNGDYFFEITCKTMVNEYVGPCECDINVNSGVSVGNNWQDIGDFDNTYTFGSHYTYIQSNKLLGPQNTQNNFPLVGLVNLGIGVNSFTYITEPFNLGSITPDLPNLNSSNLPNGFIINSEILYGGSVSECLLGYYKVEVLTSPLELSDFELYALLPDVNGIYDENTGTYELIYRAPYSDPTNGTIINPNYFI